MNYVVDSLTKMQDGWRIEIRTTGVNQGSAYRVYKDPQSGVAKQCSGFSNGLGTAQAEMQKLSQMLGSMPYCACLLSIESPALPEARAEQVCCCEVASVCSLEGSMLPVIAWLNSLPAPDVLNDFATQITS